MKTKTLKNLIILGLLLAEGTSIPVVLYADQLAWIPILIIVIGAFTLAYIVRKEETND